MQAWDDATVTNSVFVDTAAPGRSSLDFVLRRAFKAERTVLIGGAVLKLFWDIKGFYDSVDISVLVRECIATNLPLDVLACVSLMHLAPRALEHLQCYAAPLSSVGRSLLSTPRSRQVAYRYNYSLYYPQYAKCAVRADGTECAPFVWYTRCYDVTLIENESGQDGKSCA